MTFYLHSGNHAIAEYDAQLNLKHKVVYAPGIDRPVAFIQNSQIYYYHQDEVGSVVALSDAAGNLVEKYSYSPFGESDDISVVGNPLRYTARHWDDDAHLYYNRARYYHPELGRFIQPDPLGYADGLNIYAYVGNDPLNFVDPLGLYGQEGGEADGIPVWRVHGGAALMDGRYWSPVDPRTVKNYRDAAGLPNSNTGADLTQGLLIDRTGVIAQPAAPLDGNAGRGIIEYFVPNPNYRFVWERLND